MKFRVVKSTKENDNDYGLGKAIYKLVQIAMEISKEKEPEYYAWMMKMNTALKNERIAREKRLKIEGERPKRKKK